MLRFGELISDYRWLAARIGPFPCLTQLAGGNISVRNGARMVIKSSGYRIGFEGEEGVSRLLLGQDEGAVELVGGAKASMELMMHLVCDSPVVVHVHSVSAAAYSIIQNLEIPHEMNQFMIDIPYAHPGQALADLLQGEISSSAWAALLRNHGLLIRGRTVDEVLQRLRFVEASLHRELRQRQEIGHGSSVEIYEQLIAHSFFPDQVVLKEKVSTSPDPARTIEQAIFNNFLKMVASLVRLGDELSTLTYEQEMALLSDPREKERLALKWH